MRKLLDKIRNNGIDGLVVSELIEKHKSSHTKSRMLYERYKASAAGVPILTRKPVDYEDFETDLVKRIDNKVNNTLNNSFDAEIVDTKIGYMFGHPISYEIDKERQTNESFLNEIKDFGIINNIDDKDAEFGKKAAICGYSARLAYVDKKANVRIMNINPWEAVFLGDSDYTEPEYALRYFHTDDYTVQAEFYDAEKYYTFESKNGGTFEPRGESIHTFDYCPMFGLPNNEELISDSEKVLNLIDAYDRTLSDANNEIEQYRLAYLIFKGMGVDDETISQLNRSGIFELFGEKDEVSYLTKNINDTMIENHLDRLEENIMRFAKSVNFSDDAFGGNISGVAMRFKLLALENKCITMERKMTAALRYQFKVICSAWAKKNVCVADDYISVWFGFKRNIPVNLLDEAQTTAQLKGLVSDKTRLSLLTFVDDADYEIEEMGKEGGDVYEGNSVFETDE